MSLYFKERIEEHKEDPDNDKSVFTFPWIFELPPLNEKFESIKVLRRMTTSYNFNAISWYLRLTNDRFYVYTRKNFVWNAFCKVSYNLYYDNDMRFELYSSSTISAICDPNSTYFSTPNGFFSRFHDELVKGKVRKVIVFVEFSFPMKNFNRPFDLPLHYLSKKYCEKYPKDMDNDYRFEFLKDSDYAITCRDGSMPALQMVLNVSSEFMKKHLKESKGDQLIVEHSLDVIKPIIIYLHSLCFEMPKTYELDFADRLFIAIDFFKPVQKNDIEESNHKSLCQKLVEDHIDFESLLQWLRISIQHRLSCLWNMICALIANKFYSKWNQTFPQTEVGLENLVFREIFASETSFDNESITYRTFRFITYVFINSHFTNVILD